MNIDPQQDVKQMNTYPIKKDVSQFDNIAARNILNNLHYRDDKIKWMKRKLAIEDNGNIEEQNQILP